MGSEVAFVSNEVVLVGAEIAVAEARHTFSDQLIYSRGRRTVREVCRL